MPLEGADGSDFSSDKAENHECIISLKRKVKPQTFDKLVRILDYPIEHAVSSRTAHKLVYTRAGFLIGHQSIAPHKDVEYFWDTLSNALISKSTSQAWDPLESKLVLRTLGALVLWRISIRPEHWKVSFTDTGKYDIVSGKEIKVAQYWIEKKHTMTDLMQKFRGLNKKDCYANQN